MAGLLDDLGGVSGDDTVKDQYGQTQADRRKPLWSGLINAGLLAVAGGQNLMPADRAKYIAGAGQALGGIGPAMQEQQTNAAQNQLRQQQIRMSGVEMQGKQAELAQAAQWRAYAASPEFKQALDAANATPAERMAAQAAAMKGDFATVSKVLDPKRNQPQVSGNLIRMPDGSVVTSTGRVVVGPDGKPPAGGGNDAFDPSKPDVGGTDRLNMAGLGEYPHAVVVQAMRVARGEQAPPSSKTTPDAPLIIELAAKIAGANGTSFKARQAFEQSLTSGDLNKTVIAPWSASMQHGQEAQEAFDELGNIEGGKYAQLLNTARNTWGKIDNPDVVRAISRYDRAMANYVKESEKLIAGSGQITDAVRAEVAPLSDPNKTPAQQVGIMQAMINQSHARLAQPLQNARTLRHDSTVDMNNIGLSPEGLKAYQWLNERMQKGPGTANPGSGGAPTAPKPGQTPTGKTPDGKPVYTHSDGKQYLEPE